jgi:hypothetical protein
LELQATEVKPANDAKNAMQRVFELNSVLGSNGENCCNQLWLGNHYWIAKSGNTYIPIPTRSTVVSSTSQAPKPTQTQSGMVLNCNKSGRAELLGDTYWTIAARAGVEVAGFYKFFTVLGLNEANCNTQI